MQIFVDILLHHKAKTKVEQNNKHCVDSAKSNLQTVLQLRYTAFQYPKPKYSYQLYSYKKCAYGRIVKNISHQ